MMARLHLRGERLLGDGERIGVGHLEHRRHATHHGAARPAFQVFLVRKTGFAEMHLGIDDAGQDVQALAIDHLAGAGLPQRAQRRNPATLDPDVADALAVLIDHGAGF